MEDSKRVLLAIVLTIGLLWGYTTFLAPTPPPRQPEAQKETPAATAQAPATQAAPGVQTAQPAAPAAGQAQLAPAPAPGAVAQLVQVDTPLFTAWFSERGGTLQKMELKQYFEKPDQQGGPYVLLDLPNTAPYSLGLGLAPGLQALGNRYFKANQTELSVTQPGARQDLVFSTQINGIVITKTYSFVADSYAFGLTVNILNTTAGPVELTPELTLTEESAKQEDNTYAFAGVQLQNTGALVELTTGDLEDKLRRQR